MKPRLQKDGVWEQEALFAIRTEMDIDALQLMNPDFVLEAAVDYCVLVGFLKEYLSQHHTPAVQEEMAEIIKDAMLRLLDIDAVAYTQRGRPRNILIHAQRSAWDELYRVHQALFTYMFPNLAALRRRG